MTWMKSATMVTLTPRAAASAGITSIWWQSPSTSAIQGRAWAGSRRSASSNSKAMVSARLAVTWRCTTGSPPAGRAGRPGRGPRPMTCSGVLGPSGGAARRRRSRPRRSACSPVFWPVPSRFPNACPGRPAALRAVSARRASGRIATPLPSAEIASGEPPARPAGRRPGRAGQNPSASAAAAAAICSSCRLPTLPRSAARTHCAPAHTTRTGTNISASRCSCQEYRTAAGSAPHRRDQVRPLIPAPVADPPHRDRTQPVTTARP